MVCIHMFVSCIISTWVLISHVFSSLFSYLLPQFQISDSLFWFIPVYSLLVVFSVLAFFPPQSILSAAARDISLQSGTNHMTPLI